MNATVAARRLLLPAAGTCFMLAAWFSHTFVLETYRVHLGWLIVGLSVWVVVQNAGGSPLEVPEAIPFGMLLGVAIGFGAKPGTARDTSRGSTRDSAREMARR